MKRATLGMITGLSLITGPTQAGTTVSTVEQILLYENGDLAYVYPAGGVTLTGTGDCTDQANSETLAHYSMTR